MSDDLADLRAETERGDRLEEDDSRPAGLVDAVEESLEDVDAGDIPKVLSVYDRHSAAFVHALEENPEVLDRVADALAEELGTTVEDAGRGDVLRMALRLGFREGAPEEWDAVREASRRQADEGL